MLADGCLRAGGSTHPTACSNKAACRPASVQCVPLPNRNLLLPNRYPRFTMVRPGAVEGGCRCDDRDRVACMARMRACVHNSTRMVCCVATSPSKHTSLPCYLPVHLPPTDRPGAGVGALCMGGPAPVCARALHRHHGVGLPLPPGAAGGLARGGLRALPHHLHRHAAAVGGQQRVEEACDAVSGWPGIWVLGGQTGAAAT